MASVVALVGAVAYQQGIINGETPQAGEVITPDVFAAKMETVDQRFVTMDTKLNAIQSDVNLRAELTEKELERLREELTRFVESERAPTIR